MENVALYPCASVFIRGLNRFFFDISRRGSLSLDLSRWSSLRFLCVLRASALKPYLVRLSPAAYFANAAGTLRNSAGASARRVIRASRTAPLK